VVLSTQQLEHVSDPASVLAEAHRVLRSSGRLLLSTHGVWVHHPDPLDLWRWTEEGLCTLIERAGFRVERVHRQGEFVAAAAVLVTYPLSAKAGGGGLAARLLRALLTMTNWCVGRTDELAARLAPRHLASPSYLVVAMPRNDP
jgi:SAM-dependent methyltransferase